MPKFTALFTTTISGQITIEAPDEEAAKEIAEQMEQDTLNYDDLSDNGFHAPSVETYLDDVYETPDRGEE